MSYGFSQFLHYLCFRGPGIHFDIPSKLRCLDDLKNLGKLSVQEVLGGTDDWVLQICILFSLFRFPRYFRCHPNLAQ